MKFKNKWLLVIIKVGLDISWYGTLIVQSKSIMLFIGLLSISHKHIPMPPVVTIPIKLSTHLEKYYSPYTINGTQINVESHTGYLVVNNPNTLLSTPITITYILSWLLILIIIYHLRKAFRTFYRDEPLVYQNIRHLKITSLCVALLYLLHFIYLIAFYFVTRDYMHEFKFDWSTPSMASGLIIAATIYITAEILRYGIELKKENEAFI